MLSASLFEVVGISANEIVLSTICEGEIHEKLSKRQIYENLIHVRLQRSLATVTTDLFILFLDTVAVWRSKKTVVSRNKVHKEVTAETGYETNGWSKLLDGL